MVNLTKDQMLTHLIGKAMHGILVTFMLALLQVQIKMRALRNLPQKNMSIITELQSTPPYLPPQKIQSKIK